jgi:hypothetical protein
MSKEVDFDEAVKSLNLKYYVEIIENGSRNFTIEIDKANVIIITTVPDELEVSTNGNCLYAFFREKRLILSNYAAFEKVIAAIKADVFTKYPELMEETSNE